MVRLMNGKKKDSRYWNGGISGIDWGQEVGKGLG